jgi:hypothetical protein
VPSSSSSSLLSSSLAFEAVSVTALKLCTSTATYLPRSDNAATASMEVSLATITRTG